MSSWSRLRGPGGAAAILSLSGLLLFAGGLGVSPPGEALFVVRLAVGVASVLLLPGFLLLHFWGGEAFRPIEALGLSFGLSMLLMVPLALTAFAVGLPADAVVLALVLWNIACSLRLLVVRPRWRVAWSSSQVLPLVVITFLSAMYYRWGDDLTHVSWEVGLHLSWARQYASAEPLGIGVSVVRPDLQVPNIFFLWEFALACVSRVSHLDILPVFLRARCLVPGLGLGALALMARAFLGPASPRLDLAPVLALLVALRSLVLQPLPESFSWLTREERYPGFLAGSVHHSDTAMDLLLPLLLAALFFFLRSGSRIHAALLAGSLAASFFWHPREYFQVVWYGVIAALVDLVLQVAGRRGFAPLKRYAQLAVVLFGVTVMLVALSRAASASRDSAAELRAKALHMEAVRGWLQDPGPLLTAHSPWKAPPAVAAGDPSLKPQPPQVFSFMVMAVVSSLLLACFGRRREVWLAAFLLALWWLTLCVPLIQQMLILATYSEILTSQMRFLPTVAFLLVALGLVRGAALLRTRFSRHGALAATVLGFGWALLWPREPQGFEGRIGVLNGLFICAAALVAWRLGRRGRETTLSRFDRSRAAPIRYVALFLLPVSLLKGPAPVGAWLEDQQDPMTLFGDSNPGGLSSALIDHFRLSVPARSVVQVFPGPLPRSGSMPLDSDEPFMAMPSIYAAVYQRPLAGNIHADAHEWRDVKAGRHGVYSILDEDPCAAGPILLAAREKGLDFILLQGRYYGSAACLANRRPDRISVTFDNPLHREALVRVRREVP